MCPLKCVPIKRSGFTLIELMLVLALITALTAAGIAAYQLQLRNFKVDKTALQMQQWLQAGQAFYNDCHQWPDPYTGTAENGIISQMTGMAELSHDACPNPDYATKYMTYMPKGSAANGPWSNSYFIGPYDPNVPPPGHPSPTLSRAFFVKTYLGANTALSKIAQMIAGRLPNAFSDTDGGGIFVEAVVGIPGAGGGGGSDNTHGYIVDMEMVRTNPAGTSAAKHLKMPDDKTCPPGMKAVLVGAISGIDAGRYTNDEARVGLWQTYFNTSNTSIDENGFISKIPTDKTTQKIIPSIKIEGDQDYNSPPNRPHGPPKGPGSGETTPATHQMLFITACLPNTPASKNKNLNNSVNKLWTSSAGGGMGTGTDTPTETNSIRY